VGDLGIGRNGEKLAQRGGGERRNEVKKTFSRSGQRDRSCETLSMVWKGRGNWFKNVGRKEKTESYRSEGSRLDPGGINIRVEAVTKKGRVPTLKKDNNVTCRERAAIIWDFRVRETSLSQKKSALKKVNMHPTTVTGGD